MVETNITNEDNELYSIDDFNSVFLNRDGIGAGIAVFIKKQINFAINHQDMKVFESIEINIQEWQLNNFGRSMCP